MPLNLSDRRLARSLARHAFIESRGDIETAEVLFRGNSKLVGIDPATILLLISIAFKLWQFWSSRRHDEPSSVASLDELVLMNLSEDDCD